LAAAPGHEKTASMNVRGTVVASLLSLGLAFACAKDPEGSSEGDSGEASGSGGGSDVGEAGTTANTAGTGTTTTASTSSASTTTEATSATGSEGNDSVNPDSSGSDSGPADTGSGSESGPSDSTGAVGDPCEPNDMDDDCSLCVKDACCDQVTACVDDPECNCFQTCADSMPNGGFEVIMICGDECGVADPNQHATIGPMLMCTTNSCLLDCL
jgi:hypothetical protein